MKKINIVNSMAKIIAIILFIIIAVLAINIYFSFSDIMYIETVFNQIKNTLTYSEEVYLLKGNASNISALLELNLTDLEIEYNKYKIQNQMKLITNILVLMIAFISVGTIQNLVHNIELKEHSLNCLPRDAQYKINKTLAKDSSKPLRKEGLK